MDPKPRSERERACQFVVVGAYFGNSNTFAPLAAEKVRVFLIASLEIRVLFGRPKAIWNI